MLNMPLHHAFLADGADFNFSQASMWILKALSTPLGKLVVAVERRSHFTGLQTP
jgi:hypothetical protein